MMMMMSTPVEAGVYFVKCTGKYDLQVIGSVRENCAILLQLDRKLVTIGGCIRTGKLDLKSQ